MVIALGWVWLLKFVDHGFITINRTFENAHGAISFNFHLILALNILCVQVERLMRH